MGKLSGMWNETDNELTIRRFRQASAFTIPEARPLQT